MSIEPGSPPWIALVAAANVAIIGAWHLARPWIGRFLMALCYGAGRLTGVAMRGLRQARRLTP